MAKKAPSPKCTWNRHKWQCIAVSQDEETLKQKCVFCGQERIIANKGDLNESDEQDSA